MALLGDQISQIPVSTSTRTGLLNSLWNRNAAPKLKSEELDLEAYFAYHTQQCIQAWHDGGRHIADCTHRDIAEIAQEIIDGSAREDIKSRLALKLTAPKSAKQDELLGSCIDFTARLVSMMDIGVLQYAFSGRRQLEWKHGSLIDIVHDYFNEPVVLVHDKVKLGKMFNARNLSQIAGIQIEWTDNLADHLRIIDDEDKKVAIFHHASFLRYNRSPLFPDGLAEETLRTLALLFPQTDKDSLKWFKKLPCSLGLDKTLVKCGHLRVDSRQIENFRFWHDRLVILKQVFDESRPSTLLQWWCDRRNGVQWYTFWVAILVLFLTIFFGMVQSIESALQVYKAYHPTVT
ncbi:hypothetical protein W97_06863 [Coniosporium apollinis CBS 100218]|uniref:Uncharacterized protein n=1 Tax=Coniosporium apollinis (strain CBS 100218) TaxID=1168221 RepID=R7Z0J3_CONA1|nr:uncharacterized protein W97_06863 [Coniosporium apollinis CBS 100218]EON67720.1 hypothetical protein W97_06863 [Coniosporium apollinis CBS 100218]